MKSQQLNFFVSPEEFGQLEALIHSLGFVILEADSPKAEAVVLPNLLASRFARKYFALADQLDLVSFWAVHDYFVIDETTSPVVSFNENRLFESERSLNRGRFYLIKDLANGEMKNAEFLKKSQALFKLFKKTFPDAALEGFAPFWVSPKAAELHRQGYELTM